MPRWTARKDARATILDELVGKIRDLEARNLVLQEEVDRLRLLVPAAAKQPLNPDSADGQEHADSPDDQARS